MAALKAYVIERLPLPPREVWIEDRLRRPLEYLVERDAPAGVTAPVAGEAVELREVEGSGRRWQVGLHMYRGEEHWHGYLAFRSLDRSTPAGGSVPVRTWYRTAAIFSDADPYRIRSTFEGYESETLRAFLRSVLP